MQIEMPKYTASMAKCCFMLSCLQLEASEMLQAFSSIAMSSAGVTFSLSSSKAEGLFFLRASLIVVLIGDPLPVTACRVEPLRFFAVLLASGDCKNGDIDGSSSPTMAGTSDNGELSDMKDPAGFMSAAGQDCIAYDVVYSPSSATFALFLLRTTVAGAGGLL